jgi:hypothetical protein
MLIRIAFPSNRSVNAALVNWLPWSVLKIAGRPLSDERIIERVQAEINLQADRHPPGKNPPAEPVHHRRQVEKAASHRNVGVSRPEEFHPRALAELDVNLSAHPAPIIRPMTRLPATSERTHPADLAPAA